MNDHFDQISRKLTDAELQLRVDKPDSFQADAIISAANELKRRQGVENSSPEITELVSRIDELKLKSENINKDNHKLVEEFEAQLKGRIASFGERLLAYLLDLVIMTIPLLIIIDLISDGFGIDNIYERRPITNLISLSIWFIYYIGWESSSYKATPGKLLLKLKVVNSQGERLSIKIAALRYVGKLLSALTLGIGLVPILTEPRKRALHDRLSESYVVFRPRRFDNNLLNHSDINVQ